MEQILGYTKIKKENDEIIIDFDSSKINFVKHFNISSTRNISLIITKNEDIFIRKTEYDVKETRFVETNIYDFKEKNKIEVIDLINKMLQEKNFIISKSLKDGAISSYKDLLKFLKTTE